MFDLAWLVVRRVWSADVQSILRVLLEAVQAGFERYVGSDSRFSRSASGKADAIVAGPTRCQSATPKGVPRESGDLQVQHDILAGESGDVVTWGSDFLFNRERIQSILVGDADVCRELVC